MRAGRSSGRLEAGARSALTARHLSPARFPSAAEIESWLVAKVADELEIEPESIDVVRPLTRYGLDSLAAVVITGELEEWLGHPLPPDVLTVTPSIEAITQALTADDVHSALAKAAVDYEQWSRRQRVLRRVVCGLVRMLTRVEVSGLERVPRSGPFILAGNHLHAFDVPISFSLLPVRVVFLATDKFQRMPGISWFLKHSGGAVYIARGESDREALLRGLEVLRLGGRLAVAPEGNVSRPGLSRGRTGAAYLAVQARAPIVPIAIHGHERPVRNWLRLRRLAVRMHVGAPIELPPGRAGMKQLEEYTHDLMVTIAGMLPPRHRGVYASAVED